MQSCKFRGSVMLVEGSAVSKVTGCGYDVWGLNPDRVQIFLLATIGPSSLPPNWCSGLSSRGKVGRSV